MSWWTLLFIVVFVWAAAWPAAAKAAKRVASPTPTVAVATESATLSASDSAKIVEDKLTETTPAIKDKFALLLSNQDTGRVLTNPLKHGLRAAIAAGVPANTLVLLLLLPVIASVIAAARQVVGLRGFGIYMPAALSVAFIATGPVVGIGLFLIIVLVSTLMRMILRKLKIKLQYLPRMAIILWSVSLAVLGLLFITPAVRFLGVTDLSIFPILFLILLAEDFTRVQLGKSIRTAVNLTTETLILAVASYGLLTLNRLQELVLLYPEVSMLTVVMFNILIGRYVGLRVLEMWRFRKLIYS